MRSNPSPADQAIVNGLKQQREAILQDYFDRETRLRVLQIFIDINNDIARATIGVDTEDAKLNSLLGHGGLWRDIDPLLGVDRLELFKASIRKVSQSLEGNAWDNYQKGEAST